MLQFSGSQRAGHDLATVLQQPPPEDLSHPGTEPMSIVSPALADGFFYHCHIYDTYNIQLLFHPR